ncbi:DNA polymerase delta subunit 2 [Cymbomonas tetramitiformis]|uniref:DNA polymerase delta subunit 2 n=1 Tax=Cymbomonas tetramitiformis TaxID=36881 RepID=A0AAE0GXQ8_9CHLO|nr:DNA polymerase delta subunit 2 [Cymbomonas tetramitiformis]
MESTLRWQHMALTAPDTLATYPFTDRDPFILESCPHVYFAGNQAEYGTRLVKNTNGDSVRLVSLPRFSQSGMAVLVNVQTLACHPITFSTSEMSV